MVPLFRYICSLSFFHYSEYLVTAIINPHSLSLDSFLLNHSVEYTLAAVSSWVEFTVEKLTVPGWSVSFSSILTKVYFFLFVIGIMTNTHAKSVKIQKLFHSSNLASVKVLVIN